MTMTDLKNTNSQGLPISQLALATLYAWLLPGAGHLFLGRRFKGIAYMVIINGLFLSGLVMSHGEAMSLHKDDGHRLAFAAEIGAGGPALLGLAITHRKEIKARFNEDVVQELADEREEHWKRPETIQRLPWHDTGLLYCMVAGLLNFLIIYEASTGGRGLVGAESGSSEEAAPKSEEAVAESNVAEDKAESKEAS